MKQMLLILALMLSCPSFANETEDTAITSRNHRLIIGKSTFTPWDSIYIADTINISQMLAFLAYERKIVFISEQTIDYFAPRSEYYRIKTRSQTSWAVYNSVNKNVFLVLVKGPTQERTNWPIIFLLITCFFSPFILAINRAKIYRTRSRKVKIITNIISLFLGLLFWACAIYMADSAGISNGSVLAVFISFIISGFVFSFKSLFNFMNLSGKLDERDNTDFIILIIIILMNIGTLYLITTSFWIMIIFALISLAAFIASDSFFTKRTHRYPLTRVR